MGTTNSKILKTSPTYTPNHEFYEIEPGTTKPFVRQFWESMDMFHKARSDALNVFDNLGL